MYARPDSRGFHLNPTGLAGALTINGAVLAALFLAAPELVMPTPDGSIEIRNIPIPPPPEPLPEPEPLPRADALPVPPTVPNIPVPPIPLPPAPNRLDGTIEISPIPPAPIPLPPFAGTGTASEPAVEPPAPAFVDARRDPRYLRDFQPDYPPAERRAEREGSVTVRVRIGADGRVKEVVRVAAASDAFFDATRRQALSRWRFRPATRGEAPVESWQTLTVRFVLENAR